jgi:BCD family chlorophyll transporter-like MFS transporter
MVVELALPAMLPGFLVGFHYLVQMVRPRMGFGADQGRRCTPWMMGGMFVLALGGFLASLSTVWMAEQLSQGVALSILAFMLIGFGVSACGTSLLVLMSKRVAEARRAPAATVVWMMMIVGFAATAMTVGKLLDPYTPQRLLEISGGLSVLVVLIASLSLWNLEAPVDLATSEMAAAPLEAQPEKKQGFKKTLIMVWSEPQAKAFTVFVFLSMLAYSSQDLILEPFAAVAFGFSPAETTTLSGLQNGGVLIGMLFLAFITSKAKSQTLTSLSTWTICGCLASALAMLGLVLSGPIANVIFFQVAVFLLGIFNGAFSIAAIGSMMQFASIGSARREGVRMGIWGASQAMAFGLGGIIGTGLSDIARIILGDPASAYAFVFLLEGVLFVVAAYLSYQTRTQKQTSKMSSHLVGV